MAAHRRNSCSHRCFTKARTWEEISQRRAAGTVLQPNRTMSKRSLLSASCMTIGEGGRRDKKAAVLWYRRAAIQGHSGAQVNLAISYLRGDGVEQNETRARLLLEKASDQNDSRAFFGLALIHEQGRGVPS